MNLYDVISRSDFNTDAPLWYDGPMQCQEVLLTADKAFRVTVGGERRAQNAALVSHFYNNFIPVLKALRTAIEIKTDESVGAWIKLGELKEVLAAAETVLSLDRDISLTEV